MTPDARNPNEDNWADRSVVVAPTVLVQEIDNEAVLLDTASETYFELNSVGAWVVSELTERRRFEDLVAAVAGRFEIDEATAAGDLRDLLDDLHAHGLLTVG